MSTNAYAVSYLGISMGKHSGVWKIRNIQRDVIDFPTHGQDSGIFGGGGIIIEPNFYLGIEGFGDINHIKTKQKRINSDTVANSRSEWSVGVSAIPAHYIFQNSLLFLRIGLVDSHFITEINDDNQAKNIIGYQFGFGAQTKLIKKLDIRLEYVYTTYPSRNIFGNQLYPQDNLFNLGILYRFDDHPCRSCWVRNVDVAQWDGRKIINTGKYSQFPKNAFDNLVDLSGL